MLLDKFSNALQRRPETLYLQGRSITGRVRNVYIASENCRVIIILIIYRRKFTENKTRRATFETVSCKSFRLHLRPPVLFSRPFTYLIWTFHSYIHSQSQFSSSRDTRHSYVRMYVHLHDDLSFHSSRDSVRFIVRESRGRRPRARWKRGSRYRKGQMLKLIASCAFELRYCFPEQARSQKSRGERLLLFFSPRRWGEHYPVRRRNRGVKNFQQFPRAKK